MILVCDNYDSFTYNLVQYLGEWGAQVEVFRNDAFKSASHVGAIYKEAKGLVISPGPGGPEDAGISKELIGFFAGKVPILGVCLGHQCIGQFFGGEIIRSSNVFHGKTSIIRHDGEGVLKGMDNPLEATRYHSLLLRKESIPFCLKVTAETKEGEVMGIRHSDYDIEGLQFHPESILTGNGKEIIHNFVVGCS